MKMGGRGYASMGASSPRTHKRSTNVQGIGIPKMESVGKLKGAVMRSSGPGATAAAVGSAKPMSGPKTTKTSAKMGTAGITSQGERQAGMSKGRSRVSVGKNNIGRGRSQSY